MERYTIKVKETQVDLLLSGFRLVYKEFLRHDLSSEHMEYVTDALNEIATNCNNAGFGYNLAKIQHECQIEQRLLDLKTAYDLTKDIS